MNSSNKILINKDEVTAYIPQQPPIVMVDELIFIDEKKAVSTFLIQNENMFVKNGFLTESGIIENLAQTAALKAGYEIRKHNLPPQIGFIAGIKNLKVYKLPEIGQTLHSEIFIFAEILGITIINAKSFCNNIPCAACELRIAINVVQ